MPLEQLGVKCLAQGHIGVSGFGPGSLTPKACVLSTPPSPYNKTNGFMSQLAWFSRKMDTQISNDAEMCIVKTAVFLKLK